MYIDMSAYIYIYMIYACIDVFVYIYIYTIYTREYIRNFSLHSFFAWRLHQMQSPVGAFGIDSGPQGQNNPTGAKVKTGTP